MYIGLRMREKGKSLAMKGGCWGGKERRKLGRENKRVYKEVVVDSEKRDTVRKENYEGWMLGWAV